MSVEKRLSNEKLPRDAGEPIRQVASLTLHEYAASFIWDPEHVGAYPTWNSNLQKTVRPGNELCLMRNMSSADFCKPCIEGMWHQFLMRMSLIDDVTVSYDEVEATATVTLVPVPVGQFREVSVPAALLDINDFVSTSD
eukprot:COSAG01_NODE_5365_length_4308_cov_1.852697_7_plen_139_part_00